MSGGKFWSRNTKAAKITASQVADMRARYRRGGVTQGDLAREYGLGVVQVGRILRHESWTDVIEQVTDTDLQQSAERMMALQKSLATNRMAEDIARAKEKEKAGDKMLNELTGDQDERSPDTPD